ncbi:MAG: hypothetical protein AAF333_08840 [Planctomycetota bacterium]
MTDLTEFDVFVDTRRPLTEEERFAALGSEYTLIPSIGSDDYT